MNWSSLVLAVLFGIQQEYVSAQSLQVLVNGEITNDTRFCINQTLTFVCTVQLRALQWTVGSILSGNDGAVSIGQGGALNTKTVGMFTLTAEGTGAPNFRSTLTVDASVNLNGTMITCADNLNSNINQATEVSVHGPPFITVNADTQGHLYNLMISLNIPHSVTLGACLHNITASLYRIDGSTVTNEEHSLMVDNSDLTFTFTGLNFCDFNYNYTVMGIGIINSNSVSDHVTVSPARGNIQVINIAIECNKVTIIVDVTFDDCPNSMVRVSRSDGQVGYLNIGPNQMLEFTDSEAELETCTAFVILNSGLRFNIGPFECDMTMMVATTHQMVQKVSQPSCQCWSYIGGLIGVIAICTAIITVLTSIIVAQGYKIRSLKINNKDGRRAHEINVEYDEIKLQNKSRKQKLANQSREVVLEECVAYGRVSSKTDHSVAIATSNAEAVIPGVYEAI